MSRTSHRHTLWGTGRGLGRELLDHAAAADRSWDARLLRWDVLGSLGHIEGLRASGLLGARDAEGLLDTVESLPAVCLGGSLAAGECRRLRRAAARSRPRR